MLRETFAKAVMKADAVGEKIFKGAHYVTAQKFSQVVIVLPVMAASFALNSPGLMLFGGLIGGGIVGSHLGRKAYDRYNKPSQNKDSYEPA